MGFFSHIFTFAVGVYVGRWMYMPKEDRTPFIDIDGSGVEVGGFQVATREGNTLSVLGGVAEIDVA